MYFPAICPILSDLGHKYDGPLDYIDLYKVFLAFVVLLSFGPYAFKHKLKLFWQGLASKEEHLYNALLLL